jgi:hypothetical protein
MLDDHGRPAVLGLGVGQAIMQPCQVGVGAVGEFHVSCAGASEAVIASNHVQRQESDAAEIPAGILAVLGILRVVALPHERDAAAAEAVPRCEEKAPELC